MRKILATAIISALTILPTFAAAQTTPATDNSALIAVLEQLVQVLTQEINQLLAKQAPAVATSSTATQTFTTPSGAVIDGNGNVISAPAQSSQTSITVTANTPPTSTNTSPVLALTLGQVTETIDSAYLSWTTNLPANSKYGSSWNRVGEFRV